eukprot:6077311-Amphidinium_carterae.2
MVLVVGIVFSEVSMDLEWSATPGGTGIGRVLRSLRTRTNSSCKDRRQRLIWAERNGCCLSAILTERLEGGSLRNSVASGWYSMKVTCVRVSVLPSVMVFKTQQRPKITCVSSTAPGLERQNET